MSHTPPPPCTVHPSDLSLGVCFAFRLQVAELLVLLGGRLGSIGLLFLVYTATALLRSPLSAQGVGWCGKIVSQKAPCSAVVFRTPPAVSVSAFAVPRVCSAAIAHTPPELRPGRSSACAPFSNVVSNQATVIILYPIVKSVRVDGVSLKQFVIILIIGASSAFMTPTGVFNGCRKGKVPMGVAEPVPCSVPQASAMVESGSSRFRWASWFW